MPENPYEPSRTTENERHRSAFRYLVFAGILFALAIAISTPGIALLNRQPLPRRYATYDPEFIPFGRVVSEATIVNGSLGLAAALALLAIAMLIVALRVPKWSRR